VPGVIRDVTGREVHRFFLSGEQGQHILDTRVLPAGTYTVEFLLAEGNMVTERLIVQP